MSIDKKLEAFSASTLLIKKLDIINKDIKKIEEALFALVEVKLPLDNQFLHWKDGRLRLMKDDVCKPLIEHKANVRLDIAQHFDAFLDKATETIIKLGGK